VNESRVEKQKRQKKEKPGLSIFACTGGKQNKEESKSKDEDDKDKGCNVI
jgi:hypothetical protein